MSYKDREIGFHLQAAKGTDGILAETPDACYVFGRYNMPIGDFAEEEQNLVPAFQADLEATEMLMDSKNALPMVGFGAVNIIPLYHFLGKATNNTSYIEIESIGSGDRPYITLRDKMYKSGEYINNHIIDCQCHSLNFNYDIRNTVPVVWVAQFGALSVDHTVPETIVPTYPGSQDEQYKYDSNMELKWDDHVIDGVIAFSVQSLVHKADSEDDSSLFPTEFFDMSQIYQWQLTCIAGATNTIELLNDYRLQDQDDQTTFKAIQSKLYSTATKYIQLNLSTCGQNKPIYGDINIKKGEVPTVTFSGKCLGLKGRVPLAAGAPTVDTVPLAQYGL